MLRIRPLLPRTYVEGLFLSWGPGSSAEVRGFVIDDIKEVEGVRQQEEQVDGRDEEIGKVEEIRENAQLHAWMTMR